jgi:hypothetical protein
VRSRQRRGRQAEKERHRAAAAAERLQKVLVVSRRGGHLVSVECSRLVVDPAAYCHRLSGGR